MVVVHIINLPSLSHDTLPTLMVTNSEKNVSEGSSWSMRSSVHGEETHNRPVATIDSMCQKSHRIQLLSYGTQTFIEKVFGEHHSKALTTAGAGMGL